MRKPDGFTKNFHLILYREYALRFAASGLEALEIDARVRDMIKLEELYAESRFQEAMTLWEQSTLPKAV